MSQSHLTPPARTPLYLDFETETSASLKLAKMTLREYLRRAAITGCAWALGDEPVQFLGADDPEWPGLVVYLRELAAQSAVVWVAHNAAFDIRAARFGWTRAHGPMHVPQPHTVHCSMELAMAAWPNQPGGYSLNALAETLFLPEKKIKINLESCTPEELAAYCSRDVELGRAIYKAVVHTLPPEELRIAELTNNVRELHCDIDHDAVERAITTYGTLALECREEVLDVLGEEGSEAFGMDGAEVFSVKPQTLKDVIRDTLGIEFQTISLKKINPDKLSQDAEASAVIHSTARANKALSHKRRATVFRNRDCVDLELGYYRAHTGRFSSPAPGCRGLNLHNLAKRDKVVAKAIRTMFRLPEGWVAVRADLANVEYRIEGFLTRAYHPQRLFTENVLADPYLGFGNPATGRIWTKADAIRAVFKAAVLGLGYGMSYGRFAEELMRALADPTFGVSLADLEAVVVAQGWGMPKDRYARAQASRVRAPTAVAIVAYHMRELFHRMHPEYLSTARWLIETLNRMFLSVNVDMTLDHCYQMPQAPAREDLEVIWAGDKFGSGTKSVQVRCGPWMMPTVTWRDLRVMQGKFGVGLHSMQGKAKGYRSLHPSLVIENVIQSAARNAMCRAQLELDRRGYPYQLTVHDELMLLVPRDREWVVRAQADLIDVLGPGNQLGWDWSCLIDPSEVNVSQTLYEVDVGKLINATNAEWWARLRAGESKLLENLP